MSDDLFDTDAFLDSAVAHGPMDTQYEQCPEGSYRGQCGEDIKAGRGESRKDGSTYTFVDLPWEILDEGVKAQLGRDKVVVYQRIFIDFDDNGDISAAKGKNVELGATRAACGLNDVNPFNFRMFAGKLGTVRVTHRTTDRGPRAQVSAVAASA